VLSGANICALCDSVEWEPRHSLRTTASQLCALPSARLNSIPLAASVFKMANCPASLLVIACNLVCYSPIFPLRTVRGCIQIQFRDLRRPTISVSCAACEPYYSLTCRIACNCAPECRPLYSLAISTLFAICHMPYAICGVSSLACSQSRSRSKNRNATCP
jgi:hypothetical protein